MTKKTNRYFIYATFTGILIVSIGFIALSQIIREDMEGFPPCRCVINGIDKEWKCIDPKDYNLNLPERDECK